MQFDEIFYWYNTFPFGKSTQLEFIFEEVSHHIQIQIITMYIQKHMFQQIKTKVGSTYLPNSTKQIPNIVRN